MWNQRAEARISLVSDIEVSSRLGRVSGPNGY
jgi:hypothetical protein